MIAATMADIFISYKREDRERVEPLAQALEREGFSVWWDPELPIGQSYSSSIHTELNAARAVIAVWTNLSVQSEWVQEEATQAKRRSVLYPIRFDAVEPPIGFSMVETADLSDWHQDDRNHPEWSRLLEQLHAKLRGGATSAASLGVAVLNPPRVVVRKPQSRRAALIGGAAFVVAIVATGVVVQRSCSGVPQENSTASAGSTPGSSATSATAPAVSVPARSAPTGPAPAGSAPAATAPIMPREVAAPSVAAGTNSTIFDARPLALGVAEPGELFTQQDTRFYKIDNTLKLRDLAIVRLQNESGTLRPNIKVLNGERSLIVDAYDTSPGASVQRTVTLEAGVPIYVQVLPFGSNGGGKYKLSVTPQKAHDAFEPNDDILSPAAVKVGTDIVANVMDKEDRDWYRVSGATKTSLRVIFENLSTTLKPDVKVYDGNKSQLVDKYDTTAGANLNFTVDIRELRDFYVEVAPFGSGGTGKYRLRIE